VHEGTGAGFRHCAEFLRAVLAGIPWFTPLTRSGRTDGPWRNLFRRAGQVVDADVAQRRILPVPTHPDQPNR
jgi:hypothetical protein